MKKIIALPFLFLCVFSAIAQSPQAIPYQAVLRNADGSVMANQAVTITFTIHNNAVDGTTEYQENHNTTSNALGLINLNVGQGTPSVGTFSTINWGSGTKFLQVAMNSGNGNIDLGTQQMLSVPYALYARNTDITVSSSGDTLVVGGHSVIIPGISAANTPSLTVGQNYQGGVIAYIYQPGDNGYVAGEIHGIVATISDLPGTYIWGCINTEVPGAWGSSIGTGLQNTTDLVNANCSTAALACSNLILNGYDDWYLPSRDELQIIYSNRELIGGFPDSWYWSSSQFDSATSWRFDDGLNYPYGYISAKYDSYSVRPIRNF